MRQQPHEEYFADILRRQQRTIFMDGRCGGANSYYFDHHGDAPMLRPASGPEMFWRARHFDLDHSTFTTSDRAPAQAAEGAGK